MKRTLFIAAQWLVIALAAAGVAYTLMQPVPPLDYHPESWKDWRGFVAISYAGIGPKASGRYASSDTLAAHLDALTAAGYKTITPGDAAAYLAGRRPLPEKAVLLLFELGRKDSFIRATPLLRRRGMRATMCVPTVKTRQWGRFYMKENEIRRAAGMSAWTFAAMGHEACEDGFLTQRRTVDGHTEPDGAFERRIRNDYFTASQILENAVDKPITAYLYPSGNNGSGPEADPMAREMNRRAVSSFHRIAFARTDDAFNDRNRDPYDLGYIQVRGKWSGEELVKAMERFLPVSLSGAEVLKPEYWSMTDGCRFNESQIAVAKDGLAWLRGTIPWTDVDVTARIELRTQETVPALYVRHTGSDSYLRVTLGNHGVRIQESAAGRLQTLKWHESPVPSEVPQEVRIRAKGNRFWVWLNGQPISEALPLSRSTSVGRIGIGSQGGVTMVGYVKATALPGMFALVDRPTDIPAAAHDSVKTILSNWFNSDQTPELTDELKSELLNAAQAGISTIPVLRAPQELTPGHAADFAEKVDTALAHPVTRTLIDRLAVIEPADNLTAALRDLGWNVVHVIDADNTTDCRPVRWEGDMLFLHGAQNEVRTVLDQLLRICPTEQLAAELPEDSHRPAGVQCASVFPRMTKEVRP